MRVHGLVRVMLLFCQVFQPLTSTGKMEGVWRVGLVQQKGQEFFSANDSSLLLEPGDNVAGSLAMSVFDTALHTLPTHVQRT